MSGLSQRHLIERPRLMKLLDETTARIILLVAPAGYGKTTLARQWVEPQSHLWYRCDASAADAAAFARGIARASEPLAPGASTAVGEFLRRSFNRSDPMTLADVLSEALTPVADSAIVVIDDAQHLGISNETDAIVERLVETLPIRMIVTARQRPNWIQPRQLLYREALEVRASELAMTSEEVQKTLGSTLAKARELMRASEGWPAVVGLASVANLSRVPNPLPGELYDFLAEEVFASFSRATQDALITLALVPTLSRGVVHRILGAAGDVALSEASAAGFVTESFPDDLTIHPLLRSFLREHSTAREETERVFTALREERCWDDAFNIASESNRDDLMVWTVREALEDLLEAGRTATLADWVRRTRELVPLAPELDLAEAEIAFRDGAFDRAEALGLRAAVGLPEESELRSAAYFRSGQAAQFAERMDQAIEYFELARSVSTTRDELAQAVWGAWAAATYVGSPDALTLARDFESLADETTESRLRVATARLYTAQTFGGLEEALSYGKSVSDLAKAGRDPMVRCAFLYCLARGLSLQGQYSAARELTATLRRDAEVARLHFAVGEADQSDALSSTGLRQFARAGSIIDRIHNEALGRGDTYRFALAACLRLRLAAVVHRRVSEDVLRIDTAALQGQVLGEFFASLALFHASSGDVAGAGSSASRAIEASQDCETRVLAATAVVVASGVARKPAADRDIEQLAQILTETQVYDGVVCGYRIWPDLIKRLLAIGFSASTLGRLVTESRDRALAASFKLPVPAIPAAWSGSTLTAREREVLELIAEGLTNKEIGARLYISTSTAKVHVLHILEKLGVRSRTEAALRLQAADDS